MVLVTVGPPGSLFEVLLPKGVRVLSGELAAVDPLLDDVRFFGPFRPFFDPVVGRPVDPDGDVSAPDVPQGPHPAGL